ncbi:MAG: DUF4259 domain-containing protein [Bacteroidetes bacterium]|nr:DUF4259 domain-containing protein [Bacteroidota bacterium]MBL0020254.1 DUF4259 domain-containing protein [Bacteroidota bacterium]MBP6722424.1 DUF4259 domain-containing protein [Bacteroidia bacterium]
MGAWDYGFFDNDAALDCVDALEDSENPKAFFKRAFSDALKSTYLDQDDAHAVTVSAVYIDFLLNGTHYGEDHENLLSFANAHPKLKVDDLRGEAVKALQKVIGPDSELQQLWAENKDDFPSWKRTIEDLIARLK